jgi:RNA polymerase sigma-70 factor (family 1)
MTDVMKRGLTDKDFEDIYIKYFSKMVRFAQEYVISDETAKNIVQDVFADFWEKRKDIAYGANTMAFLFVALKNGCIDFLRHKVIAQNTAEKMQEESMLALRANYDALDSFDQKLFDEEDIEQIVDRAIAALPDRCRMIFIKSKIEGKKQKEIAAEMNLSLNTVEYQIYIAYKKLKEALKEYAPLLAFLLLW